MLIGHCQRQFSKAFKYQNVLTQRYFDPFKNSKFLYCSNIPTCSKDNLKTVEVHFDHGLPILTIPLPSRKEKCQFLLRPISDNVEIFCNNLSKEDKGIDYVAVHNNSEFFIDLVWVRELSIFLECFRLLKLDSSFIPI